MIVNNCCLRLGRVHSNLIEVSYLLAIPSQIFSCEFSRTCSLWIFPISYHNFKNVEDSYNDSGYGIGFFFIITEFGIFELVSCTIFCIWISIVKYLKVSFLIRFKKKKWRLYTLFLEVIVPWSCHLDWHSWFCIDIDYVSPHIHVTKYMSCHKAIAVMTWRGHSLQDSLS